MPAGHEQLSETGPFCDRLRSPVVARDERVLNPCPKSSSLRHLVDTVTGLAERGIGFRSLQEAIDTTTPGGKLVFHVFAALAEFERDLVRERTSAGLAAARARGRRGGRPSVLTGSKLQVAREMHASGQYTVAAIAKTLGVSRASIYRHLDRAGG
jgi:DNA invertase Pin-like site-specific DNA recombinase